MNKLVAEFQTFLEFCVTNQPFSTKMMTNIKNRYFEIQNKLMPVEKAHTIYQILLQESQSAPTKMQGEVIDFFIQFLKEASIDSQILQALFSKIMNHPSALASEFSYLVISLMKQNAQNALFIQREISSYLKLKGLDYSMHRVIDQIFRNDILCEESYYYALVSFEELLKEYCSRLIEIGCKNHYEKVLNVIYTRCKDDLLYEEDLLQLEEYYYHANDIEKSRFLSLNILLKNPSIEKYVKYRNQCSEEDLHEKLPSILSQCKRYRTDIAIKIYEKLPVLTKDLEGLSLSDITFLKDILDDSLKSDILFILKNRIHSILNKGSLSDEVIDIIEVISYFDIKAASIYCGLSSISSHSLESQIFRYKYLKLLNKINACDKMHIYSYK